MNQNAISRLQEVATTWTPQPALGRACQPYVLQNLEGVHEKIIAELPSKKLSRRELREYCDGSLHSTEACFLATMCWGGIRANNLRSAWNSKEKWLPTLNAIRTEQASRSDHFAQLKDLMDNGALIGIRAAFFTKLLYFIRVKDDAFIMDQWLGKSINLLFNESIVPMNGNQVHRRASAQDYETFCQALEAIAQIIQKTPQETEEILFSRGGRNPGEWRAYVRDNYRPFQ